VCRTGTHLFMFIEFVEKFRGWGKGLRNAVGEWYMDRPLLSLQVQLAKYQQRGGWSHRDVLRLAKPRPIVGSAQSRAFGWAVGKEPSLDGLELLQAFEDAKSAKTAKELVRLIQANKSLSWEMVPSELLKDPAVWDAFLPNMGLTALLRNLGRLTSIGLIGPFKGANKLVAERIVDGEALQKARVHPMALLIAYHQYKAGEGLRGNLTWHPSAPVLDALNDGFHAAFRSVVPAGKRTMLAIDISASMQWDSSKLAGTNVTSAQAAAAMALVTHRTEPECIVTGFSHDLVVMPVGPRTSLREMESELMKHPASYTNISSTAVWAHDNNVDVETIMIYTDNETNGGVHPHRAMEQLRQKLGHEVRLIVVGMATNEFTVADPNDPFSLDVVGFDASAPAIMSEFSAGRL
jgi:60 kDa SS-A/Ro ribonucleoprotein